MLPITKTWYWQQTGQRQCNHLEWLLRNRGPIFSPRLEMALSIPWLTYGSPFFSVVVATHWTMAVVFHGIPFTQICLISNWLFLRRPEELTTEEQQTIARLRNDQSELIVEYVIPVVKQAPNAKMFTFRPQHWDFQSVSTLPNFKSLRGAEVTCT